MFAIQALAIAFGITFLLASSVLYCARLFGTK